jgi:SAM-dependent methyltransferase
MSLTADGQRIFSLGCGNGFVEADLARLNRTVRAIDYNKEAVELTRGKGVDAFAADYYTLNPADIADEDVIYADGFLGHLFDSQESVQPALGKLASLCPKSGAYLVISNDAPKSKQALFAPHERLQDFWLLSKDYLAGELASFGWQLVESYYFPYIRPISGMRNRTICVARVP